MNNQLIHSFAKDRYKVYSTMKKLRNEKSKPVTKILETPVGVYHGSDVLEGFAADAEHLGRETPENNNFDNDFYNLCKLDNLYIFTFKGSDTVKLPAMKMAELNSIIKHMKPGKACA